jgi:hypothetical protein
MSKGTEITILVGAAAFAAFAIAVNIWAALGYLATMH